MKLKLLIPVTAAVIAAALTVTASTATRTQHQDNQDLAHEIAEMMRAEGHPEDHPVIVACQEWWQAEAAAEQSAVSYVSDAQRCQYPAASMVWQLLREHGLSETVSAGILGSMMAECGGHTLDLQPYLTVDGFYGLCMFGLSYFPDVAGQDIHGQIDVLMATIEPNMEAFGFKYADFLALTDVRTAARWFSDGYERPAVWNEQRADNAEAALAYFGGR